MWATILTVLETVKSFWKLVNKNRFPTLKDVALKMCWTLGNTHSTCVRAHTFSTLKQVKSKAKSEIECRSVTKGAHGRTKTPWKIFAPPWKMCWTYFKTIGHSSKGRGSRPGLYGVWSRFRCSGSGSESGSSPTPTNLPAPRAIFSIFFNYFHIFCVIIFFIFSSNFFKFLISYFRDNLLEVCLSRPLHALTCHWLPKTKACQGMPRFNPISKYSGNRPSSLHLNIIQ